MRIFLIITLLLAGVLAASPTADAQLTMTYFGEGGIGSGGGGGGCTGAIDLSTGCAQPMLGGL